MLITAILLATVASARNITMQASAYSGRGRTAVGGLAQRGVAAADPRVLPLGSHVEVRGAGRYSGVYRVEDTGRPIRGRKIDVFLPSHREARRFGKRLVQVKVLQRTRR